MRGIRRRGQDTEPSGCTVIVIGSALVDSEPRDLDVFAAGREWSTDDRRLVTDWAWRHRVPVVPLDLHQQGDHLDLRVPVPWVHVPSV
jgi:hypothetical protein